MHDPAPRPRIPKDGGRLEQDLGGHLRGEAAQVGDLEHDAARSARGEAGELRARALLEVVDERAAERGRPAQ